MAFSKNPTAFPECEQLFAFAVRNGGICVNSLTYADAVTLRHKCYAYRRALSNELYTNITIHLLPKDRTDGHHRLEFRVAPLGLPLELRSNITKLDGGFAEEPDFLDDDLEAAAEAAFKSLGLEKE